MIDTNIGRPLIVICVPLARKDTNSGVMTGESNVDTVVIPTENATSPPHRYDMIFEDTPPGQHPTRISPSAIPSGRFNAFEIANARNGMIRYWAIAPTQMSNGRCARILKSSVVRVSPMLNMMIPMIIDWQVNLFATISVNSARFTHPIIDGRKNVTTAIAITTTEV